MPKIQILDIRLISLNFSVGSNADELPAEVMLDFGCNVNSAYDKETNRISVQLQVRTKHEDQSPLPFSFDATMGGLFQLDSEVDENLLKQFEMINCPAILFPYLREVISDVTKRAGYPPFYLPVVNFVKQARQFTSVAEKCAEMPNANQLRDPAPKRKRRPRAQ